VTLRNFQKKFVNIPNSSLELAHNTLLSEEIA